MEPREKTGLVLSEKATRDLEGTEAGGAAEPPKPAPPVAARTQRCGNCRAFNAINHECRRKSPVMVPLPQMSRVGQLEGFKSVGLFPASARDSWCLEWVSDRPQNPVGMAPGQGQQKNP